MAEAVKSADRVLQLLELLIGQPRGLSFTEICRQLELPKSSAHGLLNTMMARGFLEQDTQGSHYLLGIRVWEAGQAYLGRNDLGETARPILEALRDQVNETVQLAILDGTDNVYIAKHDPDQQLVLASRIGARLPAYATSLGKALLADLDDEEIDRRHRGIEFRRYTPNTISSISQLKSELAEVRARGHAIDDGEYTTGVFCVGVPIRDRSRRVIAAISVSVPSVRINKVRRAEITIALTETARVLSRRLGYVESTRDSRPMVRPY